MKSVQYEFYITLNVIKQKIGNLLFTREITLGFMSDHLDDLFVLSYLWSQISHTSFAEPKNKQEKNS